MELENPHKQEESTDSRKIAEAAVLSSVTSDLPGNPDDVARHAAGNKHLGEQVAATAALGDPVAVAQKDRVEIPQAAAATTVPETIVQTQQAGASELPVDGEETRTESRRTPQEIPDTELRKSQDQIWFALGKKPESENLTLIWYSPHW